MAVHINSLAVLIFLIAFNSDIDHVAGRALSIVALCSAEYAPLLYPFGCALIDRPANGYWSTTTIAKKTSRDTALIVISQILFRDGMSPESLYSAPSITLADCETYLKSPIAFGLACLLGSMAQRYLSWLKEANPDTSTPVPSSAGKEGQGRVARAVRPRANRPAQLQSAED